MQGKVVAVFGISGVGKTFLISRFVDKQPAFQHLQAGELIRDTIRTQPVSPEALRTAIVERVLKNQELLVAAFARFREANPLTHVVFDGHSVIDNDSCLLDIPVHVMRRLNPDRLVFIQDLPEKILRRRAADSSRIRPIRSSDELGRHQDRAWRVCQGYAQTLSLPLDLVPADDLARLSQSIFATLDPASGQDIGRC